MAGKKRKKQKGFQIFCLTLLLTLSAGGALLACGWALWGIPGMRAEDMEIGNEQESEEGQEPPAALTIADGAQRSDEEAIREDGDVGQQEEPGKYDALLADEALCRQEKIYAKQAADSEEVSLVFAGDILFDDHYAIMARMQQRGGGIESGIDDGFLEIMRSADILVVNNEFPYTDRGEPTPEKRFTFRAKPEHAGLLLDMGVDLVSLANNHASDYGEVSLTDTMDILDGLGMPYVGAGRDLKEAVKPVCFVANDMKIAILSATQIERLPNPDTKGATEDSPGVFRCWDVARLLEEVGKAKQENDFVIVFIHWGAEGVDQPDWAQKEQAEQIAAAGADLIIGSHPHVLQGLTWCSETPVVYSLGNFLFNSKSQDTCLVRVTLGPEGLKTLQFIPGRQRDCMAVLHQGEEKERVLSYIRSLSPGVNIDEEGYFSKGE